MTSARHDPRRELRQAFDEARYGPSRTLNLRDAMPTPAEAVERLDAWLRQRQAERSPDVLVITGRGKGSAGGVSPVRVAVVTRLSLLQRSGVVAGVRQHTPGSFVVRLAPFRAKPQAPPDKPPPPPPPDAKTLEALAPETRAVLRRLADCELTALGVRERGPFLAEEMLRQFARLAATVPEGPNRETRLHDAAEEALERCED